MTGTKYSTGGLKRISQLVPNVQVRLFGFTLVIVLGSGALFWISHSTWNQLDRLQKEHAAVRSESFYLGVTLRGNIRALNEKLLQFGQDSDPKLRDEFSNESAELSDWLVTNRVHLAELARLPLLKQMLIDDFEILDRIQAQFKAYQAETVKLLHIPAGPSKPMEFQERYQLVRRASRDLLKASDDLVRAQREDFGDFLAETQGTLANHQRLLKVTLVLVVSMAGALALLVYRGMIAPLRVGLVQSKDIIERQEKLASLGVLASGVAHEIRNPLTAIKMRLFSLKRSVPAVGENEDAAIISSEINRLERILKDFLLFARPSEPKLASVPAGRVLQDVSTLMKPQLERKAIQLTVETPEPVLVHADAQQLRQVLINLVQNAAESIGRNGTVRLQLGRGEAEFEGRSRPAAILAVNDTGKGIPPEVEKRLFDPFFTTKDKGTGLGLAMAATIVEKHGGLLRYETEVSRGTRFEVVLPEIQNDASQNSTH